MELPEHVIEVSPGKHTCMHCGGQVDATGYAPVSDDVEPDMDDGEPAPDEAADKLFLEAVKEGQAL